MKLKNLSTLLFSVGVSFLAGAIGSLFTVQNIPLWYETLNKPPYVPPNQVFAPVWTVLYAFIGIALFLVITRTTKHSKKVPYILFGGQLVLNTLWTTVFFGLHMPWIAMGIILMMIVSTVGIVITFRPISKVASYLMVPYLAWICFATYLTVGVALLN